MHPIAEQDLLFGLIALALILVLGRGAGDIARRLNQPEVLGQLVAGFLLGPSILGAFLPALYHTLFLRAAVGTWLSGLSWIGAILLLLIAGIEVDLNILRQEARPGTLTAVFAIVPSLVAGAVLGSFTLGTNGYFLGVVLSVTAVSVAAKILIERREMRRRYAQVILAAGVASEVFVWLQIAVVSSLHGGSPVLAGLRSAAFAVAFFLLMTTAGSRFVAWAMRGVADTAPIANAQLSLVLLLAFLAAAATEALGLHALLGAFVFGVLLTRMPRTNTSLTEGIQALTVGLFGPIFFVLAGMRVDVLQLGTPSAIATMAIMLAVATAVKVGFGAFGAKLGGLGGWESALVGVGLNLKGGTDVIVAILGSELHLMSTRAYSMYAVVSIVTVLFSPALLTALARKAPPPREERERLEREEGERRAYVPCVERVLVPAVPELYPRLAAELVDSLARTKHERGELIDIVEVMPRARQGEDDRQVMDTREKLAGVKDLKKVEVRASRPRQEGTLEAIFQAAKGDDLIAIGARFPDPAPILSLGDLQDAIIHHAPTDVLVAVDHDPDHFEPSEVRRILVATNGFEYSLAAGDVAGYLAKACNAELVALTVVHAKLDSLFWREQEQRLLKQAGESLLQELEFRLTRLGARVSCRVVLGENASETIINELADAAYDLVVLGVSDRGGPGDRPVLGSTAEAVLTQSRTPAVVLVSRRTPESLVSTGP